MAVKPVVYLGGSQTRVAGIEFQLQTKLPPWLPERSDSKSRI